MSVDGRAEPLDAYSAGKSRFIILGPDAFSPIVTLRWKTTVKINGT